MKWVLLVMYTTLDPSINAYLNERTFRSPPMDSRMTCEQWVRRTRDEFSFDRRFKVTKIECEPER